MATTRSRIFDILDETGLYPTEGGGDPVSASGVTATAVAGGTATDVQGILNELAARIAALETPGG